MIGNTMAAPRHARKAVLGHSLLALATAAGCFAALVFAFALPSGASTTEYVVVDRNSGLAINGFDPIAYFTNRAALLGKGQYEHRHAGAVWRFRNQGNRDAFAADPEVYMPRFGGYDPVGISRGAANPGDPRLWMIVSNRLFLFYTPENQAAFANDSTRIVAAADTQWPSVQLTLSP
jgi:hypothetical protein